MKRLNSKELRVLIEKAAKARKKNPELRKGQSLFNQLWVDYPELADSIRTTSADPFYNDKRLPEFFAMILE